MKFLYPGKFHLENPNKMPTQRMATRCICQEISFFNFPIFDCDISVGRDEPWGTRASASKQKALHAFLLAPRAHVGRRCALPRRFGPLLRTKNISPRDESENVGPVKCKVIYYPGGHFKCPPVPAFGFPKQHSAPTHFWS